jgi:hypothetical protein
VIKTPCFAHQPQQQRSAHVLAPATATVKVAAAPLLSITGIGHFLSSSDTGASSKAINAQGVNLQVLLLHRCTAAAIIRGVLRAVSLFRMIRHLVFGDAAQHHPNHRLVTRSISSVTGTKSDKAGSLLRFCQYDVDLPLRLSKAQLFAFSVQLHDALCPKLCIYPCWCYCCSMHCVTLGCDALGVVVQQLQCQQSFII